MPPPDADFSFRIVFEKGQGDPRRIFDAASQMIDGFEELDEAITGSVDSKIRPLMVLEDIDAGSIRVWLSSFLKKIDDAQRERVVRADDDEVGPLFLCEGEQAGQIVRADRHALDGRVVFSETLSGDAGIAWRAPYPRDVR